MSPGASDTQGTAADAFVARQGICRDYAPSDGELRTGTRRFPAPLSSGLCLAARAGRFPRSGRGLAGRRLRTSPTPPACAGTDGIVRIAVGRDATDITFMTIFGEAEMVSQSVRVTRIGE